MEAVVNTVTGALGSWVITACAINFIDSRFYATLATIGGCTVYSLSRNYALRRIVETGNYKGPLGFMVRLLLGKKLPPDNSNAGGTKENSITYHARGQ